MEDQKPKNTLFQMRLPIFLALAVICGIFIGAAMSKKGSEQNIAGNYLRFAEILNYIQQDYVDTVDVDKLVDYSITQMLEKLDPHTAYIPARDRQIADAQLESNFEGIGIEFNIIKDTIYVVSPISGGPSEKAGLMAGDKIVKVDTIQMAGNGVTSADVFKRLRGPKGTKVLLTVKRKGSAKLLTYTIIRDKIPTYSIDAAYMIDKTTGYIKISRFGDKTYDEFLEALNDLKKQGMQRLMIDLKDNGGGYLDRATNIADQLISGNKMIVYTDGKGTKYDQEFRARIAGAFETGPVVVLINEGSASASEILSGALQDNDRALIVGRRSFGKGLVQMPVTLNDGSQLRITISRYYTPSGRSIQKPYDKEDASAYDSDLLARYQHGEFFHADSIRFNDSLKYETSKGRTVYGGGGIMPDVFVGRDTSEYTKYLMELFNENVIREYTLNYYQENKAILSKMTYEEYFKSFVVTDAMLKDVIALATKNGVTYNDVQYKRSKSFIQNNVKAYIARSAWGNKGFYQIYNQKDEIYNKGLSSFKEAAKISE
ncbi:S41 family peptidase [Cytophaga aurantiaca]|uniref:S41 family peptidase n=1 Tax=Cytophaga aurantiaca TaxID=29530 RepID=UPI00035D2611|nr:S41 family peptidase [Cytophaga aurantiaca]